MDEPTKKASLDQYELDEIYHNRYPGQQECPTCGVTLSSTKLGTRLKFMGEPAHLEIYALICDNCRKLVRTVGCNLEFMARERTEFMHRHRAQAVAKAISQNPYALDDDAP